MAFATYELVQNRIGEARTGIVCKLCDNTSFNEMDVRERYCNHCHLFHHDYMKYIATLPEWRIIWAAIETAADQQNTQSGIHCERFLQALRAVINTALDTQARRLDYDLVARPAPGKE
jgi:hypothetical protein